MMTVKDHYDKHLASFYSWMMGDFEAKQNAFQDFLRKNAIIPFDTGEAIDLGAGHGLQSIPLAKMGFYVTAVDFSRQLLDELQHNAKGLHIKMIRDDIKRVKQFAGADVELVVCCGDTLLHLENKDEVERLIIDICSILCAGGKVLLTFRDYSTALVGNERFIPVRSDDTRILTCILDYQEDKVSVTDLLYEKTDAGWKQKVSSYNKVRLLTSDVVNILRDNKMNITLNEVIGGMTILLAVR